MEAIKQIIFSADLSNAEKVALAMIGFCGERTTQQLTSDIGKSGSPITAMMRGLEKAGLVYGFRRGVEGRQGADKVYSLAMPAN